jgi:hypothetical protein
LDCGEFSPLSAGDSSPSSLSEGPHQAAHPADAGPAASEQLAALMPSDGDKSPGESGDKSPHSTAQEAENLKGHYCRPGKLRLRSPYILGC